jgi:hypothetical protein
LFLHLSDVEIIDAGAALRPFDFVREILVFLFEFLQVGIQAHGRPPLKVPSSIRTPQFDSAVTLHCGDVPSKSD